MIQINCTNCKALLQIDDAFAGGVCRCRYCGTIQTVPKRLKTASVATTESNTAAAEEAGNGQSSSARSLFQRKGVIETAGSGTGLDDLAGIVASSGLTSSRLQKKPAPPAAPKDAPPPWDKKIVVIVASAGGVIALLLGIIIFMAVRDRTGGGSQLAGDVDTPPAVPTGSNGTGTRPPAARTKTPSFLGWPIYENRVVFVLDHGSYSEELKRFENLKYALFNSLKSLGPERQFQVVFWEPEGQPPIAWPKAGMRAAENEAISELQAFVDPNVYAIGVTDEAAAVKAALQSKPDAIVFVPIKGLSNDQQNVATRVLAARRDVKSNAKFYCFTLGQAEWRPAMERIAKDTGGTYQDISLDDLRRYATE